MLRTKLVLIGIGWILLQSDVVGQTDLIGAQEFKLTEEQQKKLIQEYSKKLIDEWGAESPEPYQVKPEDDQETKLKKQKVNVARMELKFSERAYRAGKDPIKFVAAAQQRLIKAQLDILTKPDEIVSVHEQSLEMAKGVEAYYLANLRAGTISTDYVAQAIYFRLNAELELLRAKKKLDMP